MSSYRLGGDACDSRTFLHVVEHTRVRGHCYMPAQEVIYISPSDGTHGPTRSIQAWAPSWSQSERRLVSKIDAKLLNPMTRRRGLNPTDRGLRATLALDIRRSLHPHGAVRPTPRRVLEQLLLNPELRLVVAFRLYSWVGEHVRWSLAYYLYMFTRGRTGCDLALGAVIGPGLRIEHRSDIVIGASTIVGSEVDVYNGVTVGKRRPPDEDEMPTIGNRVMLGTGAKVLGDVTVGDDVIVAANAVVLDDAEAGTTVAGVPARPVGRSDIGAREARSERTSNPLSGETVCGK